MELLDYIRIFLGTETPFMLLFIALFFYFIKTAREREKEQNALAEKHLDSIQQDIRILIKVWQILLQEELEERK